MSAFQGLFYGLETSGEYGLLPYMKDTTEMDNKRFKEENSGANL